MSKQPYIKVTENGPYLAYGVPMIVEETITTDERGISIEYTKGQTFEIKTDPAALCRCGRSKNAPFCDGAHIGRFDGAETASFDPILEGAEEIDGPNLTLVDNEKFCALARFCDDQGRIWNLVTEGTPEADRQTIKEAHLCPAGRLLLFDKNGSALEPANARSIAVLEDGGMRISGPLWIRGGIRVESADGQNYEVRPSQALCRCGHSENKPFCDCSHANVRFKAKKG